jgi:16S rRNA (adenine1518-N6/adenine1519-N6)-dimethyltransferase
VVKLGQNFLADPNLLEAIVRDAQLEDGDVALEIGGGEGALTERIAERVAHVHVVEMDVRLADELEALAADAGNVSVVRGDAMRLDLASLDPAPTTVPSNLPYSIATPVLLRTIAELPSVRTWTVMVQREIADRLRAAPGTLAYGSPSVLVQLACEAELLRTVNRAVFRPRPRVDSALLRLRRIAPAPAAGLARLVRDAFAHRRKPLASSVELAGGASRPEARAALERVGLPADIRAERLTPADFTALAAELGAA